ncbi:MAG: TIGR03790 family protein [Luteolibacter sp.]
MRFILIFLLAAGLALAATPDPASVAIVYNKAIPESAKLAETYRAARNIPAENLIGLDLPKEDDISREEYNTRLRDPLRGEFTRRAWWRLGKNQEQLTLPVENKIRFIALMRGVPLRIRPTSANPPPADPKLPPYSNRDEASVDSELVIFGIQELPIGGIIKNAYFESEKPFADANMPFLVLVSRIDSATWETCERMIRDAVAAEKTGLWGRAYVDIANKFPEGDKWLEGVAKANLSTGIPTVVDRFNDTLPTNYPMTDASLYYGWYEGNVNGPFLNPRFKFRPGAVAMHLHSFSAEQIRDPNKNWSAALLERGACCTIGNTYEPYLGITHYFDTLHKRLLDGSTFAEAAYAAMPAASWQGVVFGDPLYRPFTHLDGSGDKQAVDNDYRALRMASLQWDSRPAELQDQLAKAAERTRSGILAEGLGLRYRAISLNDDARKWFGVAKENYTATADKLRQEFNIISIDRALGRKDQAIRELRDARTIYAAIPESQALTGWLNIMDPPPPPPADPTKVPQSK